MDILLFTQNARKAEYFTLKLIPAGHDVQVAETLPAVHKALRNSDPDFVIVDSDTFPEPKNDYRRIIKLCRRKFLLFYDTELSGDICISLSDTQRSCLNLIRTALADLQMISRLENGSFCTETEEARQFLKENRLRPPLALLLSCLLRNRDTDIAITTLLELLWSDSSDNHQQTLYAYMNQLRMLLESRNVPFIIEKRMKGTYRIRSRQ